MFRNKYRIGPDRYRGYDYSSPGAYFVTICTKNKNHYFGEIENGKMILSEIGAIAKQMLIGIPVHFAFVSLDEFVIMPDHIHAIIVINEIQKNQNDYFIGSSSFDNGLLTGTPGEIKNLHMSSISPSSGSLPIIVRSFKSAVTKTIHITKPDFEWQKSYYDHIIRTSIELSKIRNYIRDNPIKWNKT
ncbi:MAG: transposase [Bacteroidales bacterium]